MNGQKWRRVLLSLVALVAAPAVGSADGPASFDTIARDYEGGVRPLLRQFCLGCHSTDERRGELDLEQFATLEQVRRSPRVWQKVIEMLDNGEMPPKKKPRPSDAQRTRIRDWARTYLDAEARAGAGDPGPVVLRRLCNVEYNNTVRDLTGVDLQPAREFPVDGAAGEGFTNVGDALVMSPALLDKYVAAAKGIAAHAVLLPDGFRFSEKATRRDWTDELVTRIRQLYRLHTDPEGSSRVNLQGLTWDTNSGGRIPLEPYLAATIRYRDLPPAGRPPLEAFATENHLSPKYLQTLWDVFQGRKPSPLLDTIRERWRAATPGDVAGLAAEIRRWQGALTKFNSVAHFKTWMEPVNPLAESGENRAKPPAAPDARDLVLTLVTRDAGDPIRNIGPARTQLENSFEEFRRVFPAALCYAQVVPVDEVVTLVLFHREDEALKRLILDDRQSRELDRLWEELRYVSQDALKVKEAYGQFMEYVTQDGDVRVFEPLRKPISERAEAMRHWLIDTEPRHLDSLAAFASRAYRRPLVERELAGLRDLYANLRKQDLDHEAAFRLTLARVLMAPSFLYHAEQASPGAGPQPITDWELASRLSYFLWSTMPDDELRRLAAAGTLHEPGVIEAQARRMLDDDRVRALATEFACQWLDIRGFDAHDEKSEQVFPQFASLRAAMYEESVRFFVDLFERDGSVLDVLDADHTFVDDALARHYGIPGVSGPGWRRVDGVKEHGRGGILGMAALLSKQSGASRTSPILRGNWLLETLLGEKLPRPPKGVPPLPESELDTDGLTMRQITEKHRANVSCAKCHDRIDPFGFALEGFDAIGRRRNSDLAGRPIDTQARLKDGTTFADLDGLRDYLLSKRRDDFLKQFCRKLLGYALGRSVQLSDEPLLDEMKQQLIANEHQVRAAILTVIRSPQFLLRRGLESTLDQEPSDP